jgi:hypothetical protein
MKTKVFTGLALAAVLLIGGPAFGRDDRKKAAPAAHTVAAVHRAAPHRAIAVVHRAAPRQMIATHRAVRNNTVAATRVNRANTATRNYAANRATNTRNTVNSRSYTSNRTSVAFGGSGYANGRGGYQYAFASHRGWNPGSEYYWGGHHYRWFNNGWFIIDPGFGYYGPGYAYGSGYNSGIRVSAQVQVALQQQGYYQGPVDGIVGPQTQAAIAAYQQANGLPVTGNITRGLLSDLGVG